MYTTNRWKPQKEVPVYIIASVERISSNQRLVTIECAPVPAAPIRRSSARGGQTDSAAFDAHVVIEKNNFPVR